MVLNEINQWEMSLYSHFNNYFANDYDDAYPKEGLPSYNENSYIAQIPNSGTQNSVLERENIVMTTSTWPSTC